MAYNCYIPIINIDSDLGKHFKVQKQDKQLKQTKTNNINKAFIAGILGINVVQKIRQIKIDFFNSLKVAYYYWGRRDYVCDFDFDYFYFIYICGYIYIFAPNSFFKIAYIIFPIRWLYNKIFFSGYSKN